MQIIYGKRAVQNALNNREVYKLYIQDNKNPDEFKGVKAEVIILTKQKMNSKFNGNHQGYAAEVKDYLPIDLATSLKKRSSDKKNIYIILDSLSDPQNLGSIIRSAEVFGCLGIIIPKNRSVKLNDTVVKVSTGAIEFVDIIEVNNINYTIETLKKEGFWVVGTDLNTNNSIYDIKYDFDTAIVIGNEGKGISKGTKTNCDYLVKIPMYGQINSLNASVSCAIILSEVKRSHV